MNNNIQVSNCVIAQGNRIFVNGQELPPPPCEGNSVTIINNKVYIDGYEFKKGKWRKTLKAKWHKWF